MLSSSVCSAWFCTAAIVISLNAQPILAENRIEHIELYTIDGMQDFFGEMRVNYGNVLDILSNENTTPAKVTQTTDTRAASKGARFYNVVVHIICDTEEANFSAPIDFKSGQQISTFVQTLFGTGLVWVGSDKSTSNIACIPGTDVFDRQLIETNAPPDQIAVVSGDKRFGFRAQKGDWYLSDEIVTDLVAQAQEKLNELGFDAGTPDGVSGSKTRAALQAFQNAADLPVNGTLDDATVAALKLKQTKGSPKFVSQPGMNASLPNAVALGGIYSAWILLENGVDPKSKDQYGAMALRYAAGAPHLGIVKALVEGGADVNFYDQDNPLPLVTAAGEGHIRTVRFLLENGALSDLNRAGGRRALDNAAYHGHHDVVEVLLASGADIDALNDNHRTALLLASAEGHQQIVYTLMEAGADPKIGDEAGRNAAIFVAGKGFAGIFRTMIEAGVDVNHQATDGSTALWFAVQNGQEDTVFEALDLGANPNTPAIHGQTPLLYAAYLGSEQIVRLLLSFEADPAFKSDDGRTALDVATSDPVKKLLRLALDPSKIQYELADFEPLTIALRQIKPDQALLDYTAKMLNKAANDAFGYRPEFASTLKMNVSICFGDWGGRDGLPLHLALGDFITNHIIYEREFKRLKLPETVWRDKLNTATAIALASSYALLHKIEAGQIGQKQGWKLEEQIGQGIWLIYDEVSQSIRDHNGSTLGEEGTVYTVVQCIE